MPGTILDVKAKAGDRAAKGAVLIVLESMKMEHALAAPRDGVIAEARVKIGDQIAEGETLIRFKNAAE